MWRPIPSFPSYEVSDEGGVRRAVGGGAYKAGYVLKPKPHKQGYLYYILSDGRGGAKTMLAHRLVLMAFAGPCPDGMQACHGNGDRQDNRLSNLRWDTPKANQADRVKHGTDLWGEALPYAKLTESKVKEIRVRAAAGERQCDLAREFGVGDPQIHRIVRRELWAHV